MELTETVDLRSEQKVDSEGGSPRRGIIRGAKSRSRVQFEPFQNSLVQPEPLAETAGYGV